MPSTPLSTPLSTTLSTTPQVLSGCGSTPPAPMPRDEAERHATLLKAVADPVRLQLLSIIRASENREACVCDMTEAVGLSQPTVSHHLKIMTEAGLLRRERRGTWAWFSLVPERLGDITRALD